MISAIKMTGQIKRFVTVNNVHLRRTHAKRGSRSCERTDSREGDEPLDQESRGWTEMLGSLNKNI